MAVAGAWARGFWRDRSGMALTLVLPPLVYLLFAAVFGAGARGDIDASVVLHDAARTPATAAVGEALSRDLGPRLRRLDDAQAVERAVIDGRAACGDAYPKSSSSQVSTESENRARFWAEPVSEVFLFKADRGGFFVES